MKPDARFWRIAAALAFALAAALWQKPAQALQPGDPAPVVDLEGRPLPVRLAPAAGEWLYVDFWASWCTPCRRSFPWMNEMQARYRARGLRIVAVNLDRERADAERFLRELPPAFAIAFDAGGGSARRYSVKGMPSSLLVGPDGRVVFVHSGFRDDQRAELERRIAAALPASP